MRAYVYKFSTQKWWRFHVKISSLHFCMSCLFNYNVEQYLQTISLARLNVYFYIHTTVSSFSSFLLLSHRACWYMNEVFWKCKIIFHFSYERWMTMKSKDWMNEKNGWINDFLFIRVHVVCNRWCVSCDKEMPCSYFNKHFYEHYKFMITSMIIKLLIRCTMGN